MGTHWGIKRSSINNILEVKDNDNLHQNIVQFYQ